MSTIFPSVLLRDRPLAVAGHLTLSNRGLIKQSIFSPRKSWPISKMLLICKQTKRWWESRNVCVFHRTVIGPNECPLIWCDPGKKNNRFKKKLKIHSARRLIHHICSEQRAHKSCRLLWHYRANQIARHYKGTHSTTTKQPRQTEKKNPTTNNSKKWHPTNDVRRFCGH